MIERQIARPMPRPPGLVVLNATKIRLRFLGVDANAGVRDRHQYSVGLISFCTDDEYALAFLERRHSFHAIDRKVHNHLLQLDFDPLALAANPTQTRTVS